MKSHAADEFLSFKISNLMFCTHPNVIDCPKIMMQQQGRKKCRNPQENSKIMFVFIA